MNSKTLSNEICFLKCINYSLHSLVKIRKSWNGNNMNYRNQKLHAISSFLTAQHQLSHGNSNKKKIEIQIYSDMIINKLLVL